MVRHGFWTNVWNHAEMTNIRSGRIRCQNRNHLPGSKKDMSGLVIGEVDGAVEVALRIADSREGNFGREGLRWLFSQRKTFLAVEELSEAH